MPGSPLSKLFRSRIAWDTGWSFVIKTSSVGFGFFTAVLLARMLGAEGYGIYAYAFALVTLLAMPAKAGLPQLVVRETARGVAGKPLDSVYIHLYIF
jgi:O-antigen/teichoic acid export membrane protein